MFDTNNYMVNGCSCLVSLIILCVLTVINAQYREDIYFYMFICNIEILDAKQLTHDWKTLVQPSIWHKSIHKKYSFISHIMQGNIFCSYYYFISYFSRHYNMKYTSVATQYVITLIMMNFKIILINHNCILYIRHTSVLPCGGSEITKRQQRFFLILAFVQTL